MSAEQAEALARRFIQQHNGPEYVAAIEALLAPGCVIHEYLPGVPPSLDRAGYTRFVGAMREALPDIRTRAEEVIVQGDRVAVRWTGTGTHSGADLFGIPAGGTSLVAHGIYLLHVRDDRVVELWNNWDTLNVMQQVGETPPSGPTT